MPRSLLQRGLSFTRYPKYCADLYLNLLFHVVLRRKGVEIGPGVRWYGMPIISRAADSVMRIGAGARLCSRSSDTALGVNHPVVLRTLVAGALLEIGEGVRMSGTSICAAQRITIGSRCVIGANATIVDTDFHALAAQARSGPDDAKGARACAVAIDDDVFIGAGAFILKGSTIGAGAVIGAGSVLSGHVPAGAVFCGNPARMVRASTSV